MWNDDIVELIVTQVGPDARIRFVARAWNDAYVRLVLNPRLDETARYLDSTLARATTRRVLLRLAAKRVADDDWDNNGMDYIVPREGRCSARTTHGSQCMRRPTHATTRMCTHHHKRIPFIDGR